MKPILGLALSLSFLLLSSALVATGTWPLLRDVTLLWQDNSNREGNLWDMAGAVAAKGDRVFAVGESETTAGSGAFTVKAYNAKNGRLLWQDNYDREGDGWDASWGMTVKDGKVFAVGQTTSTTGDGAFAVRAYNASNGALLWQDNYDREGDLWDVAYRAITKDDKVFVAGQTMTAAGGSAFAIRAYDASNGALLWQDNYDRAGTGWDAAFDVVVEDDNVFVVGSTQTVAGGWGWAVRAYNAKDGKLRWQDNYDREGDLTDTAYRAAVKGDRLFVTGTTETTAGGSAYAIRTYDTSNGKLLWENNYDREGSFQDQALNVTVVGNAVYTAGVTGTANGNAFTVRAYNAKDGKLVYEDYQTPEASLLENWAVGIATEGDRVFVSGVTETTAGGASFAVRAYKAKKSDDEHDKS